MLHPAIITVYSMLLLLPMLAIPMVECEFHSVG